MKKPVQIIAGICITFLILIVSSICEMQTAAVSAPVPSGLTSQIVFLLASGVLILIFNKKGMVHFRIRKLKVNQLIFPVLLTFLLMLVREAVSLKLMIETHPAASMPALQLILIVVILASVSEELLFRGFLQNMLEPLKKIRIKLYKAALSLPVIISGLFFGIIHMGILSTGASIQYAVQLVVFAMILGMIAGYYQEKHENFLYAVLVHMTANVCGLISLMMLH